MSSNLHSLCTTILSAYLTGALYLSVCKHAATSCLLPVIVFPSCLSAPHGPVPPCVVSCICCLKLASQWQPAVKHPIVPLPRQSALLMCFSAPPITAAPNLWVIAEFTCIGCKNCTAVCNKTFTIEEDYGRARVVNQGCATNDRKQEAIETCPVSSYVLLAQD